MCVARNLGFSAIALCATSALELLIIGQEDGGRSPSFFFVASADGFVWAPPNRNSPSMFLARKSLFLQILLSTAMVGILAVVISTTAFSDSVFAQDGADELTADAVEAETPPPAPTTPGSGSAGDTNRQRTILDTILAGGIVGGLIIMLSIVAVGFIIEHFISIKRSRLMPEHVMLDLQEMVDAGRINEAIEYCEDPAHACLTTDVVLAGLERYQGSEFGFAEYKSAVEEAGEDYTGRLYRKTEVLGVIGAVAPMLGLTGTVLGMIAAFNEIASSGGAPKPDDLADGIGQALVTTLLGLIVAIPCMVAFSFFRNYIDSLVAEAGKRIERLLMPLGRKR